jgi:2-oxoglutarate ferredoxin oxidoreductase subunit alpha
MDSIAQSEVSRESLDSVVIRFAGDSSDGMQLIGGQFTQASALMGNDLATFPDYPAEIQAPAGTLYGVSGFQVQFASYDISTPGDRPDVLVVMNPAALKRNLGELERGGLLIVNTDTFTTGNLKKAGYAVNPLEDGTLDRFRVLKLDISKLTLAAVESHDLGTKEALRCKNLWTLGLVSWLFGRELDSTVQWLRTKFGKKPHLAEANIAALKAGNAYAETAEMPQGIGIYQVPKAKLPPGEYRNVTGAEALSWGLAAAAKKSGLKAVLGSYPITPASTLLHTLAKLKHFGIITFQAEDEIAAICAAVGASYAGALGITTTSGPGLALKTEAVGLAIMTELPLVIVDVQRGGPSTGLPTKTEQSDLLQAVYGRNGDAPLIVLAASSPGDCFFRAIEACRLALKYMTPVILLSDGYIANGAEPWKIPSAAEIEPIPVKFHTEREGFHPYLRDPETLARVWAKPGTPGLLHRIGGIEKDYNSGNISYDPANHQKMTDTRANKIAGAVRDIPPLEMVEGEKTGDLLVVAWGSTFGAIRQAVRKVRATKEGERVSYLHVHHLNPLPADLGDILRGFKHILVPEMNKGMLIRLLRDRYLVDAKGLNKVQGQPFMVAEIVEAIGTYLA